jgi:phage terminase Nu1 subunit (DNA packaging protein)
MADAAGQASLGAYARHRGCSRQAVSHAWKAGRIQRSVVLVDGRPTIPDFAAADREWAANSDYTRQPERVDGEEPNEGEYAGAAAREKHWRAELAELQYKQRAGELVNAAEMAAAMTDAYTTVRTKLLGLPSKAKQRLPHLQLADLATLEEIVREALEELATGVPA